MPNIVDAATVYNQKILSQAGLPNAGLSANAVGSLMKNGAWNWIQNGSYGTEQMLIDVAMWYGAITSPGAMGIFELMRRCFQTMYYGGMVVKKTDGAWATWRSIQWPLALAISHGGRVMVQLPMSHNMPNADADYFWDWLWGGANKRPRAAATHGINRHDDPNVALPGGRFLHMKEVGGKNASFKSSAGGEHFGVEIALGGAGNVNPYSGKAIAPNGASGHLYLFYLPPTTTKFGGILIGCEGSSPPDRKKAKHDDTYGGGHSMLGGANIFSGTGGLKFGGAKLKDPATGDKTRVSWQDVVSETKGNLVVDLVTPGVQIVTNAAAFQTAWVGSTGV